MAKTLDDLREHLFATLDALRDTKAPMDIARAKAISNVAQTVINSAKAEIDFVRIIGADNAHLPVFGATKQITEGNTGANVAALGVRTHRIK